MWGGGSWFVWLKIGPLPGFVNTVMNLWVSSKTRGSCMDVSFLNERVRKNESARGLMRSGSGLGWHVVHSKPDGSVSFFVQQVRFRPLICLIHRQSSFTYVSNSPVSISFCSRIRLVYQFPSSSTCLLPFRYRCHSATWSIIWRCWVAVRLLIA